MKLALVLALVAVAYARVVEETSFREGYEYQYELESQALTGFPGASKHFSGMKGRCLVKVLFLRDDKCHLQIGRCEFGELNKKLPSTVMPEKQVPLSEFQPVDREEMETWQTVLSLPVEFRYVRGEVRDFSYSPEEPEWSVDTKRALVQLFQLRLRGGQPTGYDSNNNVLIRDWPEHHQQTFTVKEDSVSGSCEQLYTVNSLPIYEKYSVIQPEVPVLNVTKVKNFTTCENYPVLLNSTINLNNCTGCEGEKTQPLQSYSHTRYNLTGTSEAFLIESAEATGRHVFTPYEEKNGELTTYVIQSLKLKHSMPIRSQIQRLTGSKKQSSLRLKSLDQTNHHRENHEMREIYIVQKVLSMIEAVKEDLTSPQVIPSEAPTQLIHLIAHLRHASPAEVEEIYREIKHRQDPVLINIFMDALPMLGSPVCIKILREEMRRERISVPHAVQILTQLSYTCNKEVDTVDEMMHLCMDPVVKRHSELQKACWLSFGNMVHQTCQKVPTDESPCPEDKKETYRKVLAQGITSHKRTEQFVCLTAMGNAGLERSAQDLFYVIKDNNRPIEIRLNAIYSLQRIARKIPTQVVKFLLPIFTDIEEHYELRIAAVNIILGECSPPKQVVELVAQQLEREPNMQVGSYVYSLLNTIANTTMPCYKKLAQECQEVLRFAQPIRPGLQYSKTLHLNLLPRQFRDELRLIPALNLETIGSNTTLIPRVLHSNLEVAAMGKLFKLFGVGIRTQGLENIIKSLEDMMPQDLMPYFNNHPRNVQRNELPIEYRMREEPSLSMWFELFGTKLNMLNINKETINEIYNFNNMPELLRNLERKVLEGIDLSFEKSLPLIYSDLVIPTEVGVPLRMNLASAVVMKNIGHVKAEKSPTSINKFMPSQVKLDLELKPSFAAHIVGNMSVKFGSIETGCSIKAKAKMFYPINGKFTVDLKRMTLIKQMNTPQEDRQILNVEVQPLTFIKKTPFTKFTSQSPVVPIRMHEMINEEPVYGQDISQPEMKIYRYPIQLLGTEFVIQTLTVPRMPGSPFHPITGKQQLKVYLRKHESRVDKLELKIKYQKEKSDVPFWNKMEIEQDYPQPQTHWYQSFIPNLFPTSSSSEEQQWNPLSSSEDISSPFTSSEEQHYYEYKPRHRQLTTSSEEDSQEEPSWIERTERPIFSDKHNKHLITLALVAKSHETEIEKVTTFFTWSNSEDYTKHKMELKMVKTNRNIHEFLIQILGQIEYPELMTPYMPWTQMINKLSQDQLKIKSQLKIKLGSQGEKVINIKSITEKSPEQYEEEQKQLYKNKPEYIQCRKDERENNPTSPACRLIQNYLNQHRQMRIDIEFENMPRMVVNVTNKAFHAVKALLYPYSDINDLDVHNTPNNIHILMKLMNNSHMLDTYIKTPREIVHFNRLPLPITLEPITSIDRKSLFKEYVDLITNNNFNPICRVAKNKMQTFDKVELPLPNSECYHVLAKDCSEEQEYVVMAAEEKHTELKMVKILSHEQKIHIVPESRDVMKVLVNEQRVVIHPGHKLYVNKDSDSEKCIIYCLSPKHYTVECVKSGVRVETDGRNIEIQVSELQSPRGVQCGLCGDMNGEVLRELTGPRGEQYEEVRSFVDSYLVREPRGCENRWIPEEEEDRYDFPTSSEEIKGYFPTSSEIKDNFPTSSEIKDTFPFSSEIRDPTSSEERFTSTEQGLPLEMTRVERYGQQFICLSLKPVKTCPQGTEPERTRQKLVPFRCLPKHSREVERLLRRLEVEPVLEEMAYEKQDEVFKMPEDVSCKTLQGPY